MSQEHASYCALNMEPNALRCDCGIGMDEEAEKGQRERCKQWLHDEGLLQWCDGDEEISSLLEFVRTEAARAAKEGKE